MSKFIKIALLALIFVGCVEFEPVSDIPAIEFSNFEIALKTDSLGNISPWGTLEFKFIDGDADIGLYYDYVDLDNAIPDSLKYNLFLREYRKTNTGDYVLIEQDTANPPFAFKIFHDEKLDRVGQNKIIQGYIRVDINYSLKPDYDTFRYEFYIYDRALHKSNVDTTNDISLKDFDEYLF